MQIHDQVPSSLEPIKLAGKTSPVDYALLGELATAIGVERLAALIDAALSCQQLLIIASRDRQQLIAGLLNCLPVECRPAFSFTTGLKPSSTRPYRIHCQSEESSEARRWRRDPHRKVFCLCDEPSGSPVTAWARFVRQVVATGKSYALAGHLSASRAQLTLANLETLAQSLLAGCDDPEFAASTGEPDKAFPRLARLSGDPSSIHDPAPERSSGRRAQYAVSDSSLLVQKQTSVPMVRSAQHHQERSTDGTQNPRALEALELLDDTVFAAIAGSPTALERLRKLWPATLAKLGPDNLAESREHYIRRALATWRQYGQEAEPDDPIRACTPSKSSVPSSANRTTVPATPRRYSGPRG